MLVLRSSSRGYLAASRDPAVRARADKQTIEDATMFRVCFFFTLVSSPLQPRALLGTSFLPSHQEVWSSTDRSARKAKSDLVEDRTDSLTTVEEDYTKKSAP